MSIVAVSSKRSVDLRVTRRAGAVADEYVAIAEYSSATVLYMNSSRVNMLLFLVYKLK